MRTIIAAAVAVMLAGAAGAKAQLWGDWTADNLRTGCAPMALEVQLVGKAEADERLRERLTNSAESRLRAAGLFIEPPPVQWLTLDVLGSASEGQSTPDIAKYSVTLSRLASDTGFGRAGAVFVWQRAGIAGFGDIREAVTDLLDQFLTEYLRANPECGR